MTKPSNMHLIYKALYQCEKETNRLQFELIKDLMEEIKNYKKTCESHWPSNHNWCGCPECSECECARCQSENPTQYENIALRPIFDYN